MATKKHSPAAAGSPTIITAERLELAQQGLCELAELVEELSVRSEVLDGMKQFRDETVIRILLRRAVQVVDAASDALMKSGDRDMTDEQIADVVRAGKTVAEACHG